MRALLAVSLIALFAPAANATPIQVDFTVSLTQALGAVPGTATPGGSGYVVFDSGIANQAGFDTSLVPLDFSFDWLGQHFDTSSGALSNVLFDSSGNLLAWELDNVLPNLCGFRCVQWGTSDFTLLGFGNGIGGGAALLTQAGSVGVAIGNVSWTQKYLHSVPEPETLGLMALGLAGLLLNRRKVRPV